MQRLTSAPIAALVLLLCTAAYGQTAGTVTFTANQTSATGSLTPVLTWSTSPTASSCLASGAWSGSKFASGTETVARITASASYTLTCTWGSASTTVSWTAPTKNTDGSTLTDLASYKIVYGTSSSNLSNSRVVSDKTATSAVVSGLTAGTWYFAVRSVNGSGTESANSNVASRSISAASAGKTVAITITPSTTPTPTLKTIRTGVYDVIWVNNVRTRGVFIGSIPLGKACDASYKVGTDYYRVSKSDASLSKQPRGASIIARCAKS